MMSFRVKGASVRDGGSRHLPSFVAWKDMRMTNGSFPPSGEPDRLRNVQIPRLPEMAYVRVTALAVDGRRFNCDEVWYPFERAGGCREELVAGWRRWLRTAPPEYIQIQFEGDITLTIRRS
jgi:hypothetical protein